MRLSEHPSVVAGHGRAAIVTADGELLVLSSEAAAARLRGVPPPLLVHGPATLRRLGLRAMPVLDLLELFAFVHPARPAVPTPRGLCLALDLDPPPRDLAAEAAALPGIAAHLLRFLTAAASLPANGDAGGIAAWMGRAGWGWAGAVGAALGPADPRHQRTAVQVWRNLPEWEEVAPAPPPASYPVSDAEARARLSAILGPEAEQRPSQADYAGAAAAAFAPRELRGDPHLVLAEAGTGTGKTLGYIAPALLWAEKIAARSGSARSPGISNARSMPSSSACSPIPWNAAAALSSARGVRTIFAC